MWSRFCLLAESGRLEWDRFSLLEAPVLLASWFRTSIYHNSETGDFCCIFNLCYVIKENPRECSAPLQVVPWAYFFSYFFFYFWDYNTITPFLPSPCSVIFLLSPGWLSDFGVECGRHDYLPDLDQSLKMLSSFRFCPLRNQTAIL